MFSLQMRMTLLLGILFAILYAMAVMVGTSIGMSNFYSYLSLALFFMLIQFAIGPKIIEWSMRIRYIRREEFPALYDKVEEQARRAGIPMPKIAVSGLAIPNAFAFGRGVGDGRVCVTEGIIRLLNEEELSAVIGHELSHIKNRDVLTITLLSVIPAVMYHLAWHFLYYPADRRDRSANTALIGIIAFLFYFVTNLLVLYGSRIREYFADRGAVDLGNRPEALASALYKLVYGSARMGKSALKEAEGLKAFFLNDPSRAFQEIRDLAQLDLDRSGTIDAQELSILRTQGIQLTFTDRMMETLSTHPNMLKRIQHLSSL